MLHWPHPVEKKKGSPMKTRDLIYCALFAALTAIGAFIHFQFMHATNGKFELAACAKKNGLDAIHDTVHEMARDEARHGKALEGMLKRYFNK